MCVCVLDGVCGCICVLGLFASVGLFLHAIER